MFQSVTYREVASGAGRKSAEQVDFCIKTVCLRTIFANQSHFCWHWPDAKADNLNRLSTFFTNFKHYCIGVDKGIWKRWLEFWTAITINFQLLINSCKEGHTSKELKVVVLPGRACFHIVLHSSKWLRAAQSHRSWKVIQCLLKFTNDLAAMIARELLTYLVSPVEPCALLHAHAIIRKAKAICHILLSTISGKWCAHCSL